MSQIENRLAELGYTLPEPPAAVANYLPSRQSGNQLFLSGVLPILDGTISHEGKVGAEQTEESGYDAARICVLNALANIKTAVGSLDRISQVLLVNGFVNAVDGFGNSPQVVNGASDFLVEVLGEAGRHARAAVSVSGLPKNATVELQITVEISP
jgi:enamine deaminase RidA (YjgF/YER057c/UK114 family)